MLLARDFLSTCQRMVYTLPPHPIIPPNSSPPPLLSQSIDLIMKRNPFDLSRHFDPSPKRRQIEPESAISHQTSRPGFIDQRLIEGSQWPGYPDLVQRGPSSIRTSTSSIYNEDAQLDTFGKQGPIGCKNHWLIFFQILSCLHNRRTTARSNPRSRPFSILHLKMKCLLA